MCSLTKKKSQKAKITLASFPKATVYPSSKCPVQREQGEFPQASFSLAVGVGEVRGTVYLRSREDKSLALSKGKTERNKEKKKANSLNLD